jgi:hypothetical protein
MYNLIWDIETKNINLDSWFVIEGKIYSSYTYFKAVKQLKRFYALKEELANE